MTQRKRKIALVNVFLPPQAIGGATRVVADNIDVLMDRYADCFELVGFTSDHGRQLPHSIDVYAQPGLRVYRAGIPRRPNMDWCPSDSGLSPLFAEFLEFEKPDLVHFHCIQRLGGTFIEETRRRGIPYLVTAHDAWWISDYQFLMDAAGNVYPDGHPDASDPLVLPEGITLDESRARRHYLKELLEGASRVLTVSRAFAELYRRNGVGNVAVNRNGICPQQRLARQPSLTGRLRLAHVGGMSAHKGYPLFREALATGGYRNLEALVIDLSKPHGYVAKDDWNGVPVTFIGKFPQHRVPELYARMDVLVAPSLWPESFGLVTREAAHAGVWVVASDRGAVGEDVREGVDGNVVQVDGTEQLCAVFAAMDKSPERYAWQLPAAPVRDVESQVAELVDIYAEA
jgi:glycosyltransferase involved in cell wall biosynthesis